MAKQKILIVKLDELGDYILFRNFLPVIRSSARFRNASLTILGNAAFRPFAEALDLNFADEWIWLENKSRYFRLSHENLLPYPIWHSRVQRQQAQLKAQLKSRQFDTVISMHPTRNVLLDELICGIAPETIGVRSVNPLPTDNLYTTLLDPGARDFIYHKNLAITEALTGEKCDPPIASLAANAEKENSVAIFIGAGHWTRRWPLSRQLQLCREIIREDLFKSIYIIGGPADRSRAAWLSRKADSPRIKNVAGNLSFPELAALLRRLQHVITNDTMCAHLSAACGTPFTIITNGYSGRNDFWPYPEELGCASRTLVPKQTPPLSGFLPLRQLQQYQALRSIKLSEVLESLKPTSR